MKEFNLENEVNVFIGTEEELIKVQAERGITWHGCTTLKFDDDKKNLWVCPGFTRPEYKKPSSEKIKKLMVWYFEVSIGQKLPQEILEYV